MKGASQRPSIGDTLMLVTWTTLLDVLAHEFARLRKVPVVNFGYSSRPILSPDSLKDDELRCALRVDALIKDFARTKRWSAMDDKDKYFLRERLRYAFEYASLASHGASFPVKLATRPHILKTERRLLEWLLIDVWRKSGVVVWLDPLYTLAASELIRPVAWQREFAE